MKIYWNEIIDDKTAYFRKHFDLIEKTIDGECREFRKREKQIKRESIKPFRTVDGDEYDPRDYLADMAWEIDEMSQLMYRTFVIGVFVFMESQITYLCDFVKSSKKQTFSYKDLKGSGISRSISYLQTVLNIKFPQDANLREDFEIARIIRNALVHKDGEIENHEQRKIKSYVGRHPKMLEFKKSIIIKSAYAKFLIDLNQKICSEVERYKAHEESVD